jgi:hypothetical protein
VPLDRIAVAKIPHNRDNLVSVGIGGAAAELDQLADSDLLIRPGVYDGWLIFPIYDEVEQGGGFGRHAVRLGHAHQLITARLASAVTRTRKMAALRGGMVTLLVSVSAVSPRR